MICQASNQKKFDRLAIVFGEKVEQYFNFEIPKSKDYSHTQFDNNSGEKSEIVHMKMLELR